MRFLILGPLEVHDENGALSLGGIKLRVVLAVLLLHANEPVSAERLALALWGADAPGGAAKTVQVHVWRLRKALGDPDVIKTTAAGYCLRVAPDALDLTRFDRLVQEGRSAFAGGQPERAAVLLCEALGLWRGPALAELACEPFAGAEIARLEEQRLAAIEARVEADLAAGRDAELVGELRRLVAVHPTRECLAAQLMLALYRCGRQSDALAAYQDTRRVLVSDVGVEPGPRLRELHDAILRHEVALDPVPGIADLPIESGGTRSAADGPARAAGPILLTLPRPLHTPARTPFVGRDTELVRLHTSWRAIQGGPHSAIFIDGEAGIGKTRLAGELATAVHQEDALVLYGRCDEGLAVPYQPFVEALRPYARAVGHDRLRAELGHLAPELGRLLPELAGLGAPVRGDPESERFALFEAVAALIEVMTRQQPVLLALDDLHWAARPTLLLLRHLIRSERPLSALVLCTYRETELEPGQSLAQLLADLQRDDSAQRLSIGGLDEAAIGALVEAAVGRPLDEDASQLVRVLGAQTAGNPFFLRELLADLAESDANRSGSDLCPVVTAERLATRTRLGEVIGYRIARLPAPVGRTLRVGSVAGPKFSFVLLERVLGERSGVLDALDEAVAAGLLTEAGHGDYVFAHALVRQTVYQQLGTGRRMRLHRRLGEALEALGDTDTHVEALAHHFAQAAADGQGIKAATYALAAGRCATACLGYEEAVAHYERGLSALALSGQQIHEQPRCELLLALGQARWSTGESDKARLAFEQAADIADRIGDAAAASDAALGFSGPLFFEVDAPSTRSSEVLLQRALAVLDDHDSPLRARLMARLAAARTYAGRQPDQNPLAYRALAMARRANDEHALADVLATCCWVTRGPDDPDHHLRMARELTHLAEEVNDARALTNGCVWVMAHLLQQGEIDAVLRELDALERLTQTRSERFARWVVIAFRAMLAFLRGHLEHSEALALEGLRQWADRPQFAPPAQVFAGQMFVLRREQERLDELVEFVAAAVEQSPVVPAWRCALAYMCAHLGDRDRAWRELEVLGDLSSIPRDAFWQTSITLVATTTSVLDDHDRSRQAYDLLLPHANTCLVNPGITSDGSTSRFLGVLATTLERHHDAQRHFEDALQMNARIRSPLWTAHTQYEYARMLRLRGQPADRDRARTLLATATATATELELHALGARASAEARLAETGRVVPRAA